VDRNRSARDAVRQYYDHCWNDYRILWRTDENGSIHFGYFDHSVPRQTRSPAALARAVLKTGGAIAAALAAGAAGIAGTTEGRARAVRWLRVAARGREDRHDRAQARMTEVCAAAVGLRRGDRVLDAGCGVGGTDLWLASKAGAIVFGINVQRQHLHEASQAARRHPAGARVRFSAQDFTEMAIGDGTMDVVWALESVCHCEEKRDFITEAYRVLRPGGRLMVADFFLQRDTMPGHQAARIKKWTDGWALPNLASVKRFHSDLACAGFKDITYRDVRTHVLPSSKRLYKASLVALPINVILERAGRRSAVQGKNVRAALEQYRTLRDGLWTYGIFVAVKE
jgi:tocopherol O-methyltransferase